jgi:hypothetical protein
MRTEGAVDQLLTTARLREYLMTVLAAITVLGAVLPWVALAEAWRSVGGYGVVEMETGMRLALVSQALPYLGIQAGLYDVLAMGAAVGVILLARHRPRESDEGMRWSPAHVATGVAVVVALVAAAVRLVVSLAALTGMVGGEWADQFMAPTVTLAALIILGGAVAVLGWVAVLLAGLLYRPGVQDAAEEPAEEDEDVAPTAHPAPAVRDAYQPPSQVSPSDIRPDGASDSGYDEYRFRR